MRTKYISNLRFFKTTIPTLLQSVQWTLDFSRCSICHMGINHCGLYPVGLLSLPKKGMQYYYVYVLISESDNLFYTGYTKNLTNRISEHEAGKVKSTVDRRPLNLIYWEGCLNQQDATRREKYLKSGSGKIYLRNRLRLYLENPTG